MTEIHETELPGIGVRQEFDTVAGTRLGVLTTRTGRRELLIYDRDDPDSCRAVVHLDPEDSTVLGEMLGASRIGDAATSLTKLEGLAIDWLTVPKGSAVAGSTIGEARVRKSTGASVVAIVRGGETNAAPGPEDALEEGDVLVTVGSPDAVERMLHLIQRQA